MFRPSLGLFESSWRFWEPKCWSAQFWPLTWPWPDTWPFKNFFKSTLEPSRRDLSNAASPVSLRSLVWELVWGGVIRPPPGQWRSAETPVKRGLTLARTGGCNLPLRFFVDSEKTAARSAAGFLTTLYGQTLRNFWQKNWPGQVRSRSHDVIRGTTSGNFSNKVVFSRNLTWRHWCKW